MTQTPAGGRGESSFGQEQEARSGGPSEQPSETRNVAGAVKDRASEAVSRLQEQATSAIDSQKTTIAERMEHLAGALHRAADDLGGEEDAGLARLMHKAADGLSSFSSSMRDQDWRDLVDNINTFARRNPAVFLGGAFAVGVLAARFLKSSARHGRDYSHDPRTGISRYHAEGLRYGGSPISSQPIGGSQSQAMQQGGTSGARREDWESP